MCEHTQNNNQRSLAFMTLLMKRLIVIKKEISSTWIKDTLIPSLIPYLLKLKKIRLFLRCNHNLAPL